MKLRLALAAATCLALPVAAHAQPVTGPYLNVEGGSGILFPITYSDGLTGSSGKLLFKSSYNALFGVGYGLGNGIRIEVDGDDLHFTDQKSDDNSGVQSRVRGTHTIYGPMLNFAYDIPVAAPVFPYVGFGGGYQYVQANGRYQTTPVGGLFYSDTKGSPAFDVFAGVAFPIEAVPGLSVSLEDRFTMLTDNITETGTIPGGYPKGSPNGGSFVFQAQSVDSVFVGIRYALFTAPPPPPPVVAAPPPMAAPEPAARTYLVFFDWDKYNLTPRATDIIAQAASDSKTKPTELDVSGYTDTSGTPIYNQGLSMRRAKAVEAQLVTDGVPSSAISIHAYGETHLLVPTGPGVREPQNRRVEIVLK
jgi:OOP family OmpA-OmpF porin